ncbi:MAG: hypothetical protein R3Y28_00150 [Candidatus Gastranaerophilales bacterium]
MEKNNKKVLIIGSSAKEYALAKKFSEYEHVSEVFVASGNVAMKEFCTCVDIREQNVQELLEFAVSNDIDLTIATSELAIKADIATYFQTNGQLIFAPTAQSADFVISKSLGKKLLYKLRIPTPRFGTYDKEAMANDYLKNSNYPVVIRTDENLLGDRLVCNSFNFAKTFVSDLFLTGEARVLIEDYAYGHEFTFYVITDGYSVLPLTSVANYKFSEDGDAGLLTSGVGAFAPDYKVTAETQKYLMKNMVSNVLNSLEYRQTPYLGILGVDCVLKDDGKLTALEFRPFLSDNDCQCVLNLIEEDLYELFESCSNGAFGDVYPEVKFSDSVSVSCVLSSKVKDSVILGLEQVDEVEIGHFATRQNEYFETLAPLGNALVVTKTAKTLARASKCVYENIDLIKFEGKKYRKDICPVVE